MNKLNVMTEVYFKCTLISDVVLNSKMATEGNITSLNYIPGSNFMGIVAKELYNELSPEDALHMFHTNEILFGDAVISNNNEVYYPMPFSYMTIKGKEDLDSNLVYLYHLLNENNAPKDKKGYKAQLKQKRLGYISASGDVIENPKKSFSLKSAQDSQTRRSKEGAMFGFESLSAGQEFVFSIKGENLELLKKVTDALVGLKRVGKSKTAQYGQVIIEELLDKPSKTSFFTSESYSLIYAWSDLCFFDENTMQPTFQPTAKQLGLKGDIDWSKSQVRAYSYSPWNGRRNTADSQRNCILAGSVFYINSGNSVGEKIVGEYQAEGLGEIIINPLFLIGNQETALLELSIKKRENAENNTVLKNTTNNPELKTSLGRFLKEKKMQKQNDLRISKAVTNALAKTTSDLSKIPPSQWGNIRNYAIKEKSYNNLLEKLFNTIETKGYLTYGVAYDKYWGKNKGKALEEFNKICSDNKEYETDFVAKYSAEIVKIIQKEK